MAETLFMLVTCHLVGDYVLQTRFIAESKGENLYHLLVHCFLYIVPFYIVFGWHWQLVVIFASHIAVDPLKARYGVLSYTADQIIHYAAALTYLI